jgi:hypothetical protein
MRCKTCYEKGHPSWECPNWGTLGQPSGKYDYMVKYSAPSSSEVTIDEIVPSGWDEEDASVPLKQSSIFLWKIEGAYPSPLWRKS